MNKPFPYEKAEKQDFKGQSLYFKHRISFDSKGPITPSSDGNLYIMVKFEAFTLHVVLNPEPHYNAFYPYSTFHEHWIAEFGLPEIPVTDKGTEIINKKT